ncbi:UNVERIFIED_CONTAM: hypothetical protein FKN15_032903 [Acipenser sinensis]
MRLKLDLCECIMGNVVISINRPIQQKEDRTTIPTIHQGFCHSWMDQNTEKARFMKNILAYSMEMTKDDMTGGEGFLSCDSYAMAAAIDEEVVTEYIECAVSVELSGKLTRGMMVLDTLDLLKKKHKAFVMKTCDLEKFQCLLMAALK